jgi:hypothetical protein
MKFISQFQKRTIAVDDYYAEQDCNTQASSYITRGVCVWVSLSLVVGL